MATDPCIENYRERLQTHDWYYEFSDDHSVWLRGFAARQCLRELQKEIDPDGKIWNEYAPEDFKL